MAKKKTFEQAMKQLEQIVQDLESGDIKWSQSFGEWGSLIAANDKLIMVTGDGELIIAEASPDAFTVLSRAKVMKMPDMRGVPHNQHCFLWSHPILSNGLIYVRNTYGDLVCVDVGWICAGDIGARPIGAN